jgi:hypothetical protein
MIELRYNLNTKLNSSRPIITLTINRHEFRCLFDTGAEVPVFCVGEQIFLDTFKDAKCFKNSSISGFGKNSEKSVIYDIPIFCLSDSAGNCITYEKFKINVISKPSMPCDIILSASMFSKMRLIFDNYGESHELIIQSPKQNYGVGYLPFGDKIYIFTSE